MSADLELPGELWPFAVERWRVGWSVEREAQVRFARLAERLAAAGVAEPLVALARRASTEEARHTELCVGLVARYGGVVDSSLPIVAPEAAPIDLPERQSLAYEMVANCCITETQTTGVLTTALSGKMNPEVHAALHEITRDEVGHARLGWAYLAYVQPTLDLGFLSPWIPSMLAGTVPESLFGPAPHPELESAALAQGGLVPHTRKREVFVGMMRDVVFPGLAQFGIDVQPAKAWLDVRAP